MRIRQGPKLAGHDLANASRFKPQLLRPQDLLGQELGRRFHAVVREAHAFDASYMALVIMHNQQAGFFDQVPIST